MISCPELLCCLKAAGVDFFLGVPDSLLENFCACLTDTRRTALGCPKELPQPNKFLFMDTLVR